MGKKKKGGARRTIFQLAWAALTNGYALGYARGTIFKGWSKQFCVPGLNCYSCPGAVSACPIGALQAVAGSRKFSFSLYVVGFLLFVGSIFGRFICGWMCPFGLVQDLLYRIPLPKKLKRKSLPGHRYLVYLKYVVLALTLMLPVLITNVAGQGAPQFCQWLCPSGTLLGGWPLVAMDPMLREAAGGLFLHKSAILVALMAMAVAFQRPFCKYLCPLGAAYAPMNRFALVRLQVDMERCTRCGACERVCPMSITPWANPNGAECIRCGECVRACPCGSIGFSNPLNKRQGKRCAS